MDSEIKQKILLCGDVEGKFNALFKRINNIMKKSGEFDMLFCVGNFFGINNREFDEYKTGIKKIPIPTYILGPNKEEHIGLYPEDSELCPNLFYLGKRGIFTNRKGLKVAYISGVSTQEKLEETNEIHKHNENDVNELFELCVKENPTFRGVDLLLTSQWPHNIVNDPRKNDIHPQFSSELPSWLIMKLKPRYVVSGLEGIYYEREPFRVTSLGDYDSTLEIASRFLGLARVDNVNKEKWIYALNLTPLDKMKINELLQKTTDETVCPFDFDELQKKIFNVENKSDKAKQYFFEFKNDEFEPKNKRRRREKIEFDQEKCWFCLASPHVEKHLIVTVGEHCYLALAKGGLVEEHFLICPIQHYQNSLNQSEDIVNEIRKFKKALRKFYARKDQVPVIFERNYKTSHMQLQIIPIPKRANKELKEIFMEEAEGNGFSLNELDSIENLNQVLPPNRPYFVVELPESEMVLYTKIKGNFPINFGREVLCAGPLLNLPNRVEWKECLLGKEKEEELVKKIRKEFEPFDISTDE